jgi:hypothetical protein
MRLVWRVRQVLVYPILSVFVFDYHGFNEDAFLAVLLIGEHIYGAPPRKDHCHQGDE